MWKTISALMAIISSVIAITIYTTRLPEISDNVDANTKAIADNSTYIETVDNALENVQEWIDTVHLYKHYVSISKISGISDSDRFVFITYLSTDDKINTYDKLRTFIYNNNHRGGASALPVTGYITVSSDKITDLRGLVVTGLNSDISVWYYTSDFSSNHTQTYSTFSNISDTVTQVL